MPPVGFHSPVMSSVSPATPQETTAPQSKKMRNIPKKGSVPVAPVAPAPDGSPLIYITNGLNYSSKKFEMVPYHKVEGVLSSKKTVGFTDWYERTMPTEDVPTRVLNRVYIDLDGEVDSDCSESDFNILVARITKVLIAFSNKYNVLLKESCMWKCPDDKGNTKNKLSFGMTYKNLAGTKSAIQFYVNQVAFPALQSLEDCVPLICVGHKRQTTDYTGKLIIDNSVYENGRKMRMVGQSKPLQNRPYKIVCGGTFVDSLITYVPDGCTILAEPDPTLLVEKKTEKKQKTESINTVIHTALDEPANVEGSTQFSTMTDTDDDVKRRQLLAEVFEHLGQHRVDYYPYWIRIGFVMFNEGFTVDELIDVSRRSKHFTSESPSWIKDKWNGFRKSNLTETLIWKWLAEDNLDVYADMSLRRLDFWSLIRNPTHADVARFFYNLKPDAYLFNERLGWYQILPNNIWKLYNRTPNSLLSDVWRTFKQVVKDHQSKIDLTATDDITKEINKAKITSILKFCSHIGNKNFVDGVIAFLPSCYNDDDLDKKMDEKKHLLAFSDAVFDLDKMEVRPIKPEDFISINTGYPYPRTRFSEARKELIDTIRSIFESDDEIEQSEELGELTWYVLKTLAMCLHGQKKYEKFFVWTGSGGNGKGLIADMLKRALGDYYHTVPHQCITKQQDKKDATNPPIAKAKGKRAMMASEPEANDKLQVGTIKEMTGGDPITARDLYASTVSFLPQFVLFIQANILPAMNRIDGGIIRRLEVIHFLFKFVENPTNDGEKKVNIDLKDKIVKSPEWRDEMFHLLVEAFVKLRKEGLVRPSAIEASTSEYMDGNNPIKDWLISNYKIGLKQSDFRFQLEASDLRTKYNEANADSKTPMSAKNFKEYMECCGLKQVKHGHPFKAHRYNEYTKEWEETDCKATSYWAGLIPKLHYSAMPEHQTEPAVNEIVYHN